MLYLLTYNEDRQRKTKKRRARDIHRKEKENVYR